MVILIIEYLCIFLLFLETRSSSLEKIAVIFDGDRALVMADAKDFGKGEG
jgi:hypothetical protein